MRNFFYESGDDRKDIRLNHSQVKRRGTSNHQKYLGDVSPLLIQIPKSQL